MGEEDKIFNQISRDIFDTESIYAEIINNILYPNTHLKPQLLSEISIWMCENKVKILKMYNEGWIKFWFIRAIKNQVHSKTSGFHKNVRQTITSKFGTEAFDFNFFNAESTDEDDIQNKIEKEIIYTMIKKERRALDITWFESEIFRLYYDEGMTYRAIEESHTIDHVLAWHIVNKVRNKLKKALLQKQKSI
jgi:predicted DNA-binding protein (UPF0251 family)